MDEATRGAVGEPAGQPRHKPQARAAAATVDADLRDLNGRIAARSRPVRREAALAAIRRRAAHAAATPSAGRFARAEQAPGGPRRRRAGSPHPGGAAAGEALAERPRAAQLEGQTQQSAPHRTATAGGKIAAERAVGRPAARTQTGAGLDTHHSGKAAATAEDPAGGVAGAGGAAHPWAGLAPAAPAGGAAQGPAPAVGRLA